MKGKKGDEGDRAIVVAEAKRASGRGQSPWAGPPAVGFVSCEPNRDCEMDLIERADASRTF